LRKLGLRRPALCAPDESLLDEQRRRKVDEEDIAEARPAGAQRAGISKKTKRQVCPEHLAGPSSSESHYSPNSRREGYCPLFTAQENETLERLSGHLGLGPILAVFKG
jgi:hypothetical protein